MQKFFDLVVLIMIFNAVVQQEVHAVVKLLLTDWVTSNLLN